MSLDVVTPCSSYETVRNASAGLGKPGRYVEARLRLHTRVLLTDDTVYLRWSSLQDHNNKKHSSQHGFIDLRSGDRSGLVTAQQLERCVWLGEERYKALPGAGP